MTYEQGKLDYPKIKESVVKEAHAIKDGDMTVSQFFSRFFTDYKTFLSSSNSDLVLGNKEWLRGVEDAYKEDQDEYVR